MAKSLDKRLYAAAKKEIVISRVAYDLVDHHRRTLREQGIHMRIKADEENPFKTPIKRVLDNHLVRSALAGISITHSEWLTLKSQPILQFTIKVIRVLLGLEVKVNPDLTRVVEEEFMTHFRARNQSEMRERLAEACLEVMEVDPYYSRAEPAEALEESLSSLLEQY